MDWLTGALLASPFELKPRRLPSEEISVRLPLACAALVFVLACGGDDAPDGDPVGAPDQMAGDRRTAAPDEHDAESDRAESQDAGGDTGPDVSAPDAATASQSDAQALPVDAGPVLVPLEVERAFRTDVQPLCARCHMPQSINAMPPLDEAGAAAIHFVPRPLSTCKSLPYVVDGHPEQSYLYLVLTPGSPCKQHAPVDGLTPEALAKLADWIAVAPWR